MFLTLSALVVTILVAAIAWTFIEPHVARWRGIRAAEKRRLSERRKPTPR